MTNSLLQPIPLQNPFDAHMHWRQKSTLLDKVAPFSIAQFAGGLLMPNTDPKIISLQELIQYRTDVKTVIESCGDNFLPIFTFYLSSTLLVDEIILAHNERLIHGIKYYPKGGTTGSDKGLIGFREVRHILECMQKLGIPLLIHGETPDLNGEVVDDFERENIFLETELTELVEEYPELPIVLEHITTAAAAQFVLAHPQMRATITPQHCLLDRRSLFNGLNVNNREVALDLNKNGIFPSFMCRPILKHSRELLGIQDALKMQAQNGLRKFGLGTDTAPHVSAKKYCECGACGVFSAPIALELYAMAFEQMGILSHLPAFACQIMPEFYGIQNQLPQKKVILVPERQLIEQSYQDIVTPFAGHTIPWTLKHG